MKKSTLTLMGMAAAIASAANAATITVTNDITTSTTWSASNEYDMTQQIYVKPGATLTIQPGTVCRSSGNGSLAVCRGAKIYVNGTAAKPVIMTSTTDTMTAWHLGCNEWGNLTIMGKALIGASHAGKAYYQRPGTTTNNTKVPDGTNIRQMEGLTADYTGDPDVMYGGNDDNDNSGAIHYLSIRYGGKVLGLANELNGLSLGGIGRATEIDHVEIMNNVDDGIEIWGGTVNLKYISIWNVGDDSFDVDQGWRGKAQFGLIVQGASANAVQGSGVGDNCFEVDGAEDADAQPVTTACIYNFTCIGQPASARRGTAWRDGARVQYRNCIWMDVADKLVKNDNTDGDNATAGYGLNGTLSFNALWTTSATAHSTVNAGSTFTPAALYQAQQVPGMLAEIKDSVFYNIVGGFGDAPVTLTAATYNNVAATNSPINGLTRGSMQSLGGKSVYLVTNVDPRAANDAVASVAAAPADGFFSPAQYRGAFDADVNWLKGWTAADAYGMLAASNTEAPSTLELTATTFYQTAAGTTYKVQSSTDMVNWTTDATVAGDGTIKSATDLATPNSTKKFYRVLAVKYATASIDRPSDGSGGGALPSDVLVSTWRLW